MARPVVWISGSLTLAGIIAALLMIPGVSVQTSGDISCGSTCISYFNVTSRYSDICFNIAFIETSPEVKTEVYLKNGTKWQLFDWTKDCIRGSTKKQFKVVGHKKPLQKVKWFSKGLIPDPIWDSATITTTQNCTKTTTIYTDEITGYTPAQYINGTDYQIPIIKKVSSKVCTEYKTDVKLGDNLIYPSVMEVGAKDNTFDDVYDGNGDGICQPGESCCLISGGITCFGHNAEWILSRLQKGGLI